ncbi:MAG: cytochrome c oxidase subunit II [Chloroflexi bacterium]|nr:cytochrome c oxidase subunit II [Chloroflexota bacterium]
MLRPGLLQKALTAPAVAEAATKCDPQAISGVALGRRSRTSPTMRLSRSSLLRLRPALILAILAPALFTACVVDGNQSPFNAAGPVAEDQKNIFIFIFVIAVVVFVLVESALLYSIVRFRQKGTAAKLPNQTHGNTRLEIGWTLAPVLILAAIAIPTISLIFDQDKGPVRGQVPDNPLAIDAIGHQWWFEFTYPGEDVVTANELHIPVDRAVEVNLISDDVIHSFWVPQLAGKVDMIPGRANRLFIQADEAGTFLGQCAEFCGEAHANMRFRVIAESADDYQAWLDGMRRPPASPEPGSPAAAGQTVFAQNCSTCHTANSYRPEVARAERDAQLGRQSAFKLDPENSRIISAPNLTNLALRSHFAAGIIELNEANLRKWINDPNDIKQGNRMSKQAAIYNDPASALSSEEVDQLVAYLMMLTPVAADAVPEAMEETGGEVSSENGEQLFLNTGCSGCHSTGTNTIVGPGLGGLSDRAGSTVESLSAEDYVAQSIVSPSAYIVGGAPVSAMPGTFGAQLSAGEIDDLVAYLLSLE